MFEKSTADDKDGFFMLLLSSVDFFKIVLFNKILSGKLFECQMVKVWIIVLFVFVALRPMSTAMVIAGRSVHLTTLFPGQARASG